MASNAWLKNCDNELTSIGTIPTIRESMKEEASKDNMESQTTSSIPLTPHKRGGGTLHIM